MINTVFDFSQEQHTQRLQQQVLQQTQLQQQQLEEQQQMEERQQMEQQLEQEQLDQQQQLEQLEEEQLEQQHQEELNEQQTQAINESSTEPVTQPSTTSLPFSITPIQINPISMASLPNAFDSLNPQILQQNMQHLLTEISSQITQQQQNMQQLLVEMQNELTTQQMQQLNNATNTAAGSSNPATGTNLSNPTAAANLSNAITAAATGGTITSQPPPSYPVAVALNAVNSGQQTQHAASSTVTTSGGNSIVTSHGQQVIIQAIPAFQQNLLLSNTTALTNNLLSTGSSTDAQEQSDGTIQLHNQTYPQQILVSLPPSLTQDTLTTPSTLTQNSLTPDMLNPMEIVEIQLQEGPPNQEVPHDQANGSNRQITNELQEAIAQQIRLSGLHFGNSDLRAALGTLPNVNQLQATTRQRASRISSNLNPNIEISTDSNRQALSLLQQAGDTNSVTDSNRLSLLQQAGDTNSVTTPQLTVESLLNPEALQIFGSTTVNQNLVLQPILTSLPKSNTTPASP